MYSGTSLAGTWMAQIPWIVQTIFSTETFNPSLKTNVIQTIT